MSIFGGGGSSPKPVAPTPPPRAAEITPLQVTEKERRRRAKGRSTILTGGLLTDPRLDQPFATGLKTTLGG